MNLPQLDFFIYILILMLFIGALFIIYSIVTRKDSGDGDKASKKMDRPISFPIRVDELEASLRENEETSSAPSDEPKHDAKELDDKYQELLFLYNLMDEKQKTLPGDATDKKQGPVSTLDKLVIQQMLFDDGNYVEQKSVSVPVSRKNKEAVTRTNITPPSAKAGNIGVNPKFARVLELSKSGKTVDDIAKALEMGKGEVTLILNIEGRRRNA